MRQIICDGCKKGEEIKGEAKSGKDIKQVELEIAEDERKSVPRIPLEADLCGKCRKEMVEKYFRQKVDTTDVTMPQSLRADFVPVDKLEAPTVA
jgi:hypothetical protein